MHEVVVHEVGGCCDDHPATGWTAFCVDCDEEVGGGQDWADARADADEHEKETGDATDDAG